MSVGARADVRILLQAAVISYYYPVTWIFPTLILAGGLTTLITKRKEVFLADAMAHALQLKVKLA